MRKSRFNDDAPFPQDVHAKKQVPDDPWDRDRPRPEYLDGEYPDSPLPPCKVCRKMKNLFMALHDRINDGEFGDGQDVEIKIAEEIERILSIWFEEV